MDRAEHHKHEPERRRYIAHDAHQQMKAVRRPESAGGEQPCVLHVALTPSAIAFCGIDQSGRPPLVAPLDIRGEPDAPSGPPHQSRLNEIMRKDASTKRLAPRKIRQSTVLDEWLHPNHRIVAPIIAFLLLPVIEPGKKKRAIKPAAERLHPGE